VQPPPVPADFGFGTEVIEYAASLRAIAEQQLDRLIETNAAGLRVTKVLAQGEPADTILRAVARHEIDLITLATHGTTGWRHLLFGSVAEKVVRLANVPVLTISERVAQDSAKTERTQPAYAPVA
jgi:nucleotide-binding universal stress UspA family protein